MSKWNRLGLAMMLFGVLLAVEFKSDARLAVLSLGVCGVLMLVYER